jgi:IS30 family transposase
MNQRKPRRWTEAQKQAIWDRLDAGEPAAAIARSLGRYPSAIRALQLATGGVRPAVRHRSLRALSLEEREEISRAVSAGLSVRSIAATIERAPSTVSRELARNGAGDVTALSRPTLGRCGRLVGRNARSWLAHRD